MYRTYNFNISTIHVWSRSHYMYMIWPSFKEEKREVVLQLDKMAAKTETLFKRMFQLQLKCEPLDIFDEMSGQFPAAFAETDQSPD